ncbi:MAG TPA: hypothetical protein VFO27_02200 [Bryobacteraceae bacterium]|nr:hypothetical protein [Bryobacteraceae bacterium]
MPGKRRLLILPVVLGIILCGLATHLNATGVRADGVPIVDQAQGGLCVNGSIPSALGCTGPIASGFYNGAYNYGNNCYPRCPIYNPITGGYAYNYWTQNYWYPNDWRYYLGDSWLYCTWPGGGGWYLNGGAPAGSYCS